MKKYIADEKKIRKTMIDKNIKTINELSRLSGVSKPKIYEFLNGNTPLQTTFVRLAEFLEIDPNELIVEVEEDEY
ncbi:MAG TPA: helix-turn-helix transcriptional regulator [Sedimentibacter sp.]|jgi:transcriptional regulator with XRE-family HTH domain|uniref:helix-turn-helix domain-containing protein n=1 Tax=Pectinatus frisingensis TaxID=865 RepID=UPI0018C77F24|nr:helix-turn-helix transcriptional regulator [Pectinatus frisingensis]HOW23789.1 helix-turn-helix transcriptional regulator [Sedimentibacter sp.]